MSQPRTGRKLAAAILAAGVVGYDRLMGRLMGSTPSARFLISTGRTGEQIRATVTPLARARTLGRGWHMIKPGE